MRSLVASHTRARRASLVCPAHPTVARGEHPSHEDEMTRPCATIEVGAARGGLR